MWNNSTINPDITSYENSSSSLPFYSGFLFLLGSSFLYGSNYVPVKQFETGDGMFFQFILCLGIWLVGFVVNWFRGFPKFYALPMLGGFFWAVRLKKFSFDTVKSINDSESIHFQRREM